ncbi:MAG: 2-oxo acid dehydrogenase subunit E2 [Chloroflexi bacterium]|nr:2-oxo acid dehydrogenase subunit E2 [Chloroflexota bacterium]
MPILDVVVPEEIGDAEECVVVTWLKREGDAIQQDEVLLILQAEKISFEIPTPAAGQVTAILAQQGEVVKKGQVVARLEVTALVETPPTPSEPAAVPARPVAEVRASPIAKRLARERNVDLALVTGTGEDGRITEKDVLAFVEAQQAKAAPPPGPGRPAPPASPMAKRLAREHNVDLFQVIGTGEGGRITEKDVLAFVEARQAGVTPKPAPVAPPPAPAAPQGESIPLTGTRATIARRMHDSLHSMAQLTLHTEADMTELVALRASLKVDIPLTYTDLIVRACSLALRQHPHLNATLAGETICLLPQVNIGLAVALDDGLIVPVIAEADKRSLADLAQARIRLTERARANQLTKEEISGGTFTVTNLGNYDIDAFTPIINPPEAAILGVGRIVEKVVIYQGKIAQRAMITLSLTFDHRLVDGAPAAAFLQTIKQLLEAPAQLKS